MKKFCKIVAVLLAMLMLIGMATACKKADEGDLNNMLGGNSSLNGGNAGNSGGNGGDENGPGDEGNAGNAGNTGNTGNEGNTGSTDNKEESGNPDSNKSEQDKVVQEYDGTKKYEFASNPLFAKSKPINTGTAPSFDIDTTGFVKNNVKVADLKGKSLTMITCLEMGNFNYRDANGKMLSEWDWFSSLKKTYGLNFKFIESRLDKATQASLTYMNAGKQMDIIPTHRAEFPKYFYMTQPIDPYINMQYVNNSPGIDTRTLEQTKRHDGYYGIGPIGAVDVIWYNQTMAKELGLADPHTLWQQGKWDWDAWQNFIVSVPLNAPNGNTTLKPFSCSAMDMAMAWPITNGVNVFEYKIEGNSTKLISNFDDQRCLEAWTFFADTVRNADYVNRGASGPVQYKMYDEGSVIMTVTQYLMQDYSNCKYAKTQRFNWVPYPKGRQKGGECICTNYGNTMMLPKKIKVQSNIPYAVKVMELWANRFSEAVNDFLQEPYYKFDYNERVEYFKFATEHNYLTIGNSMFESLTGDERSYYKNFENAFYFSDRNLVSSATQLKNLVNKAVESMEAFAS